MEFIGVISEILQTRSGVSRFNGEQWKVTGYVAETEEKDPQRIVFDVWDGRSGRIEQMNLQKGKKYKLFLSFDAKKTNEEMWFNRISAYKANLIES